MGIGVVKVGRRTYAVGLLWQPSPSGRVAQAAREAASQPGQKSEFYCVRAASKSVAIPQYGLGQANQGHKSGMATLAASIANAQPGSWAGAFRLREGTWVVVVRDDLVAPDGDILFDNDEAARDRLLQEVNLGGVQRVYAPDGWSVPGSDPTPLPLLLQDRSECRLQPVHVPMRMVIYGAVGVAVVLMLIFLALQWQEEQARLEFEQAQKAMENAAKAGAVGRMVNKWEWPPAEDVYERKWEKKPRAKEVLNACHDNFKKIEAVQLGWKRGISECNENYLSVIWKNDGKMNARVPDRAKVKEDLSSATQKLEMQKFDSRGVEPLLNESELSAKALQAKWPVTLTRLPDDPPSVSPPADLKDPPPPPPSPWVKRGLKYLGKTPPWEIWNHFEGISGMIIDRMTWDSNVWTLEATLYEKRGG